MSTLRKIITTGVGAALMTENTIRNALAGELQKFLVQINLHQELKKALAGLTLEINAKIKIHSPHSLKKKP